MNEPFVVADAVEARAAEWIFERDRGELSAERRALLEQWLAADARHRELYLKYYQAWRASADLQLWQPTDGSIDLQILQKVSDHPLSDAAHDTAQEADSPGQTPRVRRPRLRRPVLAAAAVLIVALLASWALWPSGTAYSTTVGGYQRIVLDDGSVVQLNTDTQVRVHFNGHERRVALERGEAYFEVAHEASRPFFVTAGSRRIVAVGTQFSVRRDESDVQVSVTEGAVRLVSVEKTRGGADPSHPTNDHASPTSPDDGAILSAGSVALIVSAGSVNVKKRPVTEVESRLAWRTGTLIFHDQPLSEVVAEINRYHRRQVTIADPALATMPFGGNLRSTDPHSLIDALHTLNVPVRETRDGVVIGQERP